jgi:hypothetical protein
VDELNRQRPPTDQVEVDPAGLLRHHCAFPNCAQYLQNLATPRDTLLGTRRGLFQHLKYYVVPDRGYWPNLHAVCAAAFRKETAKGSFRSGGARGDYGACRDAYTARVLLAYPDDQRGRQQGARVTLLALVSALFEQFLRATN